MKKSAIVFFLSLAFGIALFVGMILNTGLSSIWQTLKQFSVFYFLIFVALSTLNFTLYNLRWWLILRRLLHGKHNVHPGTAAIPPIDTAKVPAFFRLFLHRMAGFALSYITPAAQTGGEPLRILLLHQEGISASDATSSVIIDKGLEFASLFAFIGIGFAMALIDGSLAPGTKAVFGMALVVFMGLIFWFYYSSIKNIGFFSSFLKFLRLHRFKKVEDALKKIMEVEVQMSNFYKKNGRLFLLLILISTLITGFLLLEHYLVAGFMGVHLTFFQTFLVSTIPYIAFMLPLPGGLGILESSHAAMFALLGIQINAVVLVLIIRIRDLIFVFIGLVHASKQGLKMLKKTFVKGK